MARQSWGTGLKLFYLLAVVLLGCEPRFNLFADADVGVDGEVEVDGEVDGALPDAALPDARVDSNVPDGNVGCGPTQVLCEGQCVGQFQCSSPNLCDPNCGAGQHCYDGVCIDDECSQPSDCGAVANSSGMTCSSGRCLVTGCELPYAPNRGYQSCTEQASVRQVAVGAHHACAIIPFWDQAQVMCWGDNTYGQLGREPGIHPNFPYGLQAATGEINAIALGDYHTCAKYNDGWRCWGRNDHGQLGDGTTTDRYVPTPIQTELDFAGLTAGRDFTCGRTAGEGHVYCWGNNNDGQLGTPTGVTVYPTPLRVVDAVGYNAELEAGGGTVCAINAQREIRCWGQNVYGGAGNEAVGSLYTPTRVTAYRGGIGSGISVGPTQTLVSFYEPGDPLPDPAEPYLMWFGEPHLSAGTSQLTAVPVDFMAANVRARSVSVGHDMSCAITNLGTRCWGTNPIGLGDGRTTSADVAVRVDSEARSLIEVDVGHDFACARGATTGAYCWGVNNHGELGNATGAASSVPTPVIFD